MRRALVLAVSLMACDVALPEESILCGPGGECPSDWFCHDDGHCRPTMPADAGPRDALADALADAIADTLADAMPDPPVVFEAREILVLALNAPFDVDAVLEVGGIEVLDDGDIVMAGTFRGTLESAAGLPQVNDGRGVNAYVARVTPDDGTATLEGFGSMDPPFNLMRFQAVSVCGGQAYVVGSVQGDFSTGMQNFATDGIDFLLARLSPDGDGFSWVFAPTQPGTQAALSVACAGRDLVVGGSTTGELDFASPSHTVQGDQDGFVAMFDDNENVQWLRGVGSDATGTAGFEVISGVGAVGRTVFAGGSVTSGTDLDLWIARYDFAGADVDTPHRPVRPEFQGVLAMASDDTRACVSGRFNGELVLDLTTTFSSGFDGDAFIACYGANGMLEDAATVGSANDVRGWAVAIGNDDRYLAGTFTGDLSIGGTLLENQGDEDAFLVRYASEPGGLRITGVYHVGTRNDDRIVSVVESGNRVYAAGLVGEAVTSGTFTTEGPAAFVIELIDPRPSR